MEDKVEFVRFGTKQYENRTYALDTNGVVWVSIGNMEWESLETTPRRIKRGLTAGELMLFMAQRQTRVV